MKKNNGKIHSILQIHVHFHDILSKKHETKTRKNLIRNKISL